ncbi:Proteasome assembly chaperone 3 [Rhynchospora pubera]|uniref:Proteasome assembly chaperone 3 n=1 Tax=Rhynchospora pubera TaxID=906938 RepID=A0AAV8DXN0_9POAL|nr:Proteasome assembly chaperone 3 [Rhynchospora pubera]
METGSNNSLPTQFPVSHKSFSLNIKGNKTDIVICKYDDSFMVMATQIGCMGTILHARKEESVSTDPTFHVAVIFGKRDEPFLVACARQLIEHISSYGSTRPLVLSLGLKDHSPIIFEEHMITCYGSKYIKEE